MSCHLDNVVNNGGNVSRQWQWYRMYVNVMENKHLEICHVNAKCVLI
jgi:hypothetical protein